MNKKITQKQLFEDKGYLCDVLKLMAIDEEAEIKSNSNLPTMPNNSNDITRDKSSLSDKNTKEKKAKTTT
jgi:hypothetical protein